MNKLFLLISFAALASNMPIFSMNQENDKKRVREEQEEESNKVQKITEEEWELFYSTFSEEELDEMRLILLEIDINSNEFQEFARSLPNLPRSEYDVDGLTQAMNRVKLQSATTDEVCMLKNAMNSLNLNK